MPCFMGKKKWKCVSNPRANFRTKTLYHIEWFRMFSQKKKKIKKNGEQNLTLYTDFCNFVVFFCLFSLSSTMETVFWVIPHFFCMLSLCLVRIWCDLIWAVSALNTVYSKHNIQYTQMFAFDVSKIRCGNADDRLHRLFLCFFFYMDVPYIVYEWEKKQSAQANFFILRLYSWMNLASFFIWLDFEHVKFLSFFLSLEKQIFHFTFIQICHALSLSRINWMLCAKMTEFKSEMFISIGIEPSIGAWLHLYLCYTFFFILI